MGVRHGFSAVPKWRTKGALGVALAAALFAETLVAAGTAAAAPPAPPAPETSTEATGELSAPDAPSARTIAQTTGRPVEIIGERTETSSTWARPDGTLTRSEFTAPIWVRKGEDATQAESWAAVDLRLELGQDGLVRPKAHPRDVRLSGGGNSGEAARIAVPGGSVAFQGAGDLPEPRLEGSRAVYPNVSPGIDLVLEVNRTGFEQFWVVRERPGRGGVPAKLELGLDLVTEGLDTIARPEGHVDVVDPAGTTVATLPAPSMWDAAVDRERAHPVAGRGGITSGMGAGEPPTVPELTDDAVKPRRASEEPYIADEAPTTPSPATEQAPVERPQATTPPVVDVPVTPGRGRPEARPVAMRADKAAPGRMRLTLTPEPAFLSSPNTEYPVIVDPYVNAWTTFDAYVQSNVANTDYSGAGDLRLGTYDSGATIARSFLTMNLNGLQDKTIVHSRLALWNWHSWSCNRANWEVWWTGLANSGTRWGSQPGWIKHIGSSSDTQGYGTGACGDGWVWAEITDATQREASRGTTAWGLGLKAENEGNSYEWKKFDSANAGIPPRLDVTYLNRPHAAQDLQISQSGVDSAGRVVSGTRPELSFVASHPDGRALTAIFYVYEGTRIAFEQGVRVNSGDRARLVLPEGLLKEGRTYKFRATTFDDYTFGPDGWNRLTPSHAPGKAVDVTGCGVDVAIFLQQWDWNGMACQRFGMLQAGDAPNYFSFLARSGAGAIDVYYCGGQNGTRVWSWYWQGNFCQQFLMRPTRGDAVGQYLLLARNSGQALDITAGSQANGAALQTWAIAGTPQQEFRIDPAGDGGLESKIDFRTDFTAPGAPFLTSSNYPSDGTWNGGAGTSASFTFTPSTNSADLAGYEWGLDAQPVATNSVTASSATTIQVPLDKNGPRTLQVVAKDHAGNRSAVATYKFNVGRAGITQPAAGHDAVRRVKVTVDGDPSWTQVKYVYRRGEQAVVESPVPLAHLTRADGTALTATNGFVPTADVREAAIWDVGATLGFIGGPVQIKATMRDAAGVEYTTPWVSFTVDRDADGAATSEIGPGGVNLLTGDYILSATDAEEPGLSVSRTTSSRDPDGGLQLQAEQLTANQATLDTDTAGFVGSGVTVTRDAVRGHSKAGALQIVPTAEAGTDTFAALGRTSGLQTKLAPGRRYLVSGWAFVPGATGLDPPATADGLRLVVTTKGADGTWTSRRSAKVAYTDAWQRLTLDVTIPADATDAVVRLYSGFAGGSGKAVLFDDLSVRQLWAPFGQAWSTGVTAEATGTDYVRVSLPEPELAQVDFSDGGKLWFSKGPNGWWPEMGAESLTLRQPEPDVFHLEELDGTLTVFRRPAPGAGDWLVTTTTPPVEAASTSYVYETTPQGITRIKRAVAPTQPGIDMEACATAATPPVGCVVLEYDYAPPSTPKPGALGDFPEQVTQVRMWTTDPVTRTVSSEPVARYAYDGEGRLREVWDPRIEPALKTTYAFDGEGRVTELTPVGELPWSFAYGPAGKTVTGSGDWIDPNPGRLLHVTRASLVEGSATETGEPVKSSVVYDVPVTRAAGGPYDLGASAIGSWGQTEAPTDATAVFGPDTVPTVSTATSTVPGTGGYATATVQYLNAAGRAVNVASPGGAGAPVEGFIDTVQYDKWGNAVRSLEASNRLLALRKLPDAEAQLGKLNLASKSMSDAALALSSLTTYSTDGLDVMTTTGPTQLLAIANDPASAQPVRDFTQNFYDESRPEGLNYHLVTTVVEAVKKADGSLADKTVTRNGYAVPAVCPAGSTSGWGIGGKGHGQPTTVTADAEGAALTSTVCYDAQGRATESRRPGSNGSDPGTTRTIFWTAGANAADPACGGRPEWAGAACVTRAGGPVANADLSRMAGELSVKRITAYSRYGSAERVEESATGPVNGVTATQVRSTVTTYDKADRVMSVAMSFTGPGASGAAQRTTVSTYDPASGDVVRMESVENGAVVSAVTKQLDRLGRLVRYEDGSGAWTATSFDRFGKPTVVTDSLGTETRFTYDRAKEPRGFVTSVDDSVAGTISATYGPDGQLLRQDLPGSVSLAIGYDPAGVATSRTYSVPDGPDADTTADVLASSAIVENGAGQWISHTTGATKEQYSYDALGRLTDVREVVKAAAPICTWRKYAWNNRAGRESITTSQTPGEVCTDPASAAGAEKTSYTYDTADRLQASTGAQPGTWTYDPLGRITAAPVASNPGAVVRNGFYANDLIASQQIDGVARMTWSLDPLNRFSGFTSEAWVGGAWANAVSKVNHYDSDSDSPAWIAEDATLPDEVTRFVDGLDGQLALETGKTGARVLQLVDLHGDVMTTVPIRDGENVLDMGGLRQLGADEFGNPTDLTTGRRVASTGASPGSDGRYGWLGGAQRSADALAGVILMGVRLYDPATGRFWSPDSEPGGNATSYDYCSADPVNCTDLDGRWSFFKKILKKVAKVAEIASYIPGPIGAAAGAISAGAYAATGNRKMAVQMALTAAAQLVGAGPVVRAGAAILRGAAKAGRVVGSVAAKAGRAVQRAIRPCNSFTPETGVLMADGSTVQISDIEVGDMVAARDPITGELTAQPVLDVIVGVGDKHLIGVKTARGPPTPFGAQAAGDDLWVATANHPIWVEDRGWTDAEDLETGDLTIGATGSLRVVEEAVDYGWLPGQTVYNLSVANVHTFIIGQVGDGTLVHNSSCPALTRQYANSMREARGIANQVKKQARRDGYDAEIKPVRWGHYNTTRSLRPDIVVKITKPVRGGARGQKPQVVQIHHIIVKHGRRR